MLKWLVLTVMLAAGSVAQAQDAPAVDRSATGGAQTLQDILKRQAEIKIDDSFRRDQIGTAPSAEQEAVLGTRGGPSDSDLWRALHYDEANVNVSTKGPADGILIQDGGMSWLKFREGPLATYGGYLLLGVIALLAVFFLL